MSDIAVKVENIFKKYEIGAAQNRHDTLRDQLLHGLSSLVRRHGRSTKRTDVFWALRDVSFEVRRGDVVGIIGKNGAGKSTILKILSRITDPTAGRAEIHGRVASLLEVGTGFHAELTGRENIYLNGAIMGMRKAEIERKFDEIVDFSGVEQFIDTPVKRYSTGMYVRLAFAVAAHLEPEILIVDEVLAVGDASFQKKCLGKIGNVAKEGRTVLFVSHNMAAVQYLCNITIVLSAGEVMFRGPTIDATEHYLTSVTTRSFGLVDLSSHPGRTRDSRPVIRAVGLLANDGTSRYSNSVKPGDDLVFEIQYDTEELSLDNAVIGICSSRGERLCTVGARLCPDFSWKLYGKGTLICRIPRMSLVAGEYQVMVAMGRRVQWKDVDCVEDALTFRVEAVDYFGTGETLLPGQGYFAQRSEWRMVSVPEQVGSLT
jgi:homopolymeric O-antigen transport system ATP-binding protein